MLILNPHFVLTFYHRPCGAFCRYSVPALPRLRVQYRTGGAVSCQVSESPFIQNSSLAFFFFWHFWKVQTGYFVHCLSLWVCLLFFSSFLVIRFYTFFGRNIAWVVLCPPHSIESRAQEALWVVIVTAVPWRRFVSQSMEVRSVLWLSGYCSYLLYKYNKVILQ